MAKSDDLGNDVGDGDWFRIAYEGLTEDKKHWESYHQRYVRLFHLILHVLLLMKGL